jgi:hypothetical protein
MKVWGTLGGKSQKLPSINGMDTSPNPIEGIHNNSNILLYKLHRFNI